jgi:hypothetical protein
VRIHRLELTDADMLVLNDALMLMAYGRAAPVVLKINAQLQAEADREAAPPAASNGAPAPGSRNK